MDRNPVALRNSSLYSFYYTRKKFFLDHSLQHQGNQMNEKHDPTSSEHSKESYWMPVPVPRPSELNQKVIESLLLSNLLNFQSLLGAFYESAIKGARLILDEYILPDYMKSTTVFRIPLQSVSNITLDVSQQNIPLQPKTLPNVFGYDGLIFRIVDIISSEDPSKSKIFTSGKVSVNDVSDTNKSADINRKLILQEFIGRNVISDAILRVLDRYMMGSNANNEKWNVSKSVLKASTLLSTIVDYSGYRVYVLAPADISESTSLIYGFCMVAPKVTIAPKVTMAVHTNPSIQSSPDKASVSKISLTIPSASQGVTSPGISSIGMLSPVESQHRNNDNKSSNNNNINDMILEKVISLKQNDNLFTKSYPFVDTTLSRRPSVEIDSFRKSLATLYEELAVEVNISLTSYEALSTNSTNAAMKSSMGHVRIFNLLSKKVQLHQCNDSRRYIINTSNIVPADHPSQKSSYDSLLKKFRPEYIRSLNYRLSADTFVYTEEKKTGNAILNDETSSISLSMKAVHNLYSEHIQTIATLLDSYCDHPFDSYTFTRFLHHHGLNCRHLGDLYILCDKTSCQDTIFIESIARCCKIIINRALRGLLKSIFEEADHHAKSIPNHSKEDESHLFHDYNSKYTDAKKEMILKLFNIIFGSNQVSHDFWKGPLGELYEQKYGIPLPHDHIIHYPRLFLALQYHSGNIFVDKMYTFPNANTGRQVYISSLGDHPKWNRRTRISETEVMEISQVFQDHDLLFICQPSIKYWTAFPGAFLHGCNIGESLKQLGMYRDAITIYRTLLSSYYTSMTAMKSFYKAQGLIIETEYEYAETLYLAGLYDEARQIFNSYLSIHPKYTIASARMFTLLMRVEFQCGDYNSSLRYYREAMEIYEYLFGSYHAIKPRLAIAMAEEYCQSLGYASEAIEEALGYITKVYESLDRIDPTKALAKLTLGNRLGQLYLKESLYQEALEELTQVYKDINLIRVKKKSSFSLSSSLPSSLPSSSSPQHSMMISDISVMKEKIFCLYHLTLCRYQCNFKDLAIESGNLYLELFPQVETELSPPNSPKLLSELRMKLSSQNHMEGDSMGGNMAGNNSVSSSNNNSSNMTNDFMSMKLSLETITIKRVLADIMVYKSKYEVAFLHMMDCWKAISSHPREFIDIDNLIAILSYQMSSLILSCQSADIRKYLETIESRLIVDSEGRVSNQALWNEAHDLVMKAIWSGKTSQYMNILLRDLHEYTTDGRIDERRISTDGLHSMYQAAVLVKMNKKFRGVEITPDILLQ